jgi:outer membrane protein assembly factor BamA
LDRVNIVSDTTKLNTSLFTGYLRQQPNSRWISTVKLPLGIYLMSNPQSNNFFSRFVRKMGEAPVVYDSLLSERSKQRIQDALFNLGYLHAKVSVEEKFVDHKVRLNYKLHPGRRYIVETIDVNVQDTALADEIAQISDASILKPGMPFDANVLNQERSRITDHLTDNGYFNFNRDFIRFTADTTAGSELVRLKMVVSNFISATENKSRPHQKYRIGDVAFTYDRSNGSPIWLRNSVLRNANNLIPGDIYSESKVSATYGRLNQLSAIAATNILLEPNPVDTSLLAVRIVLTPARLNSVQLGLDGTNTAGDLGAAANFSYQNRNVFHGSEVFSLKFRTAFEAIRGLKGYADQNYFEYGVDAGLQFPTFLFPFVSRDFQHNSRTSTELNIAFASQDRPEFHRRVLTSSWRYRWHSLNAKHSHRFDLLDINYVFMPWISDTFYDTYIKNPESRNAIIAYNYKNLFIVRM